MDLRCLQIQLFSYFGTLNIIIIRILPHLDLYVAPVIKSAGELQWLEQAGTMKISSSLR